MLAPVSMHVVLETPGPVRLPPFLSCTVVPLRGFSLSIILSPIIPFSGLYLCTHCQGACEADLNWRPVNLACRPLNLAHLVEWLTKHLAVKYSPHSSVFYAPTLAR